MENHFHLSASALNLSEEIHDFKSFTVRTIIDFPEESHFTFLLHQFRNFKKDHKIHQEYRVWEEGSHPEMILNMKMLEQKLDFIQYNPVGRGYVEDPSYWRYSSYVDDRGGAD
jgi:putative transposase